MITLLLVFFVKSSIFNFWQGSEYVSAHSSDKSHDIYGRVIFELHGDCSSKWMWETFRFIREISEKERKHAFYKTWTDQKPSEPTRNHPEATMNRPGNHQELIRITWFWLIPGGFLVNSRKMIWMILALFSSFYEMWNDRKRPRTYQEPTTNQPKTN